MVYMILLFPTGEKLSERNIFVLQNVYVYCMFVYSVIIVVSGSTKKEGFSCPDDSWGRSMCFCVKCCYTTRREKNERREKRCNAF